MWIDVKNLSFSYAERPIISDLSFQVKSYELTAMVGASGSGKSTLLALLAGFEQLEQGQINMSDNSSITANHRHVEWLVQSVALFLQRSVVDNIAIGCRIDGLPDHEIDKRVETEVARLGLSHLASQRAFKLSGGERQRVAVARALVRRPSVILADEPTASLDAYSRQLVMDGLRSAAGNGALVVVATHDEYVAGLCDQTVALETR